MCLFRFSATTARNTMIDDKLGVKCTHVFISYYVCNRHRTFIIFNIREFPPFTINCDLITMTTDALLYEAAARYISWDPNEETKAQMTSFVETRNVVELRAALNFRLAFGTAGLRGAMGPGYNKMNDLVILQTTQGIAKYLIDQLGPDAKKKVCTRNHY